MAEFVENKADVAITLLGCFEFCAVSLLLFLSFLVMGEGFTLINWGFRACMVLIWVVYPIISTLEKELGPRDVISMAGAWRRVWMRLMTMSRMCGMASRVGILL